MIRNFTVTNLGSYTELLFYAELFASNGTSLGTVTTFPQGPNLVLRPGESELLYVEIKLPSDLGWPNSGPAPGSYSYDIRLKIAPPKFVGCQPLMDCLDPSQTQTADVTDQVKVPTTGCASIFWCFSTNTFVYGHVYSKASGTPLPGAQVQIMGGLLVRGETDSNGLYNISITAYHRVDLGTWGEYGMKVSGPDSSYADFETAVIPRAGVPLKVDAYLTKPTETASYSVYAKYRSDGDLNLYAGAASNDGQFFAAVPFHDPLPPGVLNWGKNASVYFFANNGTLLWKYPIYYETWSVDVSDDGRYVAAPSGGPNVGHSPYVVLLDNKGNLLWQFGASNHNSTLVTFPNLSSFPTVYQAVRISHNDRYLAAGDFSGFVQLLDISTKKVLWDKFVGSTFVRGIEFSQDNSIMYVGADPYFYAFSINGTLLWRTYVNSFPNWFTSSQHYFLVSPKVSNALFLLDRSGRVVWKYGVESSPVDMSIAPDESYVLVNFVSGNIGTGIFDANGTLDTDLLANSPPQGPFTGQPGTTTTGTITQDGKHILVAGRIPPSIAILNRDGDVLWSMVPETQRATCADGYAWISPDATRMVVALCNWVYFLRGSITLMGSNTTTSATVTSTSSISSTSSTASTTSSSATTGGQNPFKVNPQSGPNGTLVTISGTGARPSYVYRYCYSAGAPDYSGPQTPCPPSSLNFTTLSDGSVPASPPVTLRMIGQPGAYKIVISDTSSSPVTFPYPFSITSTATTAGASTTSTSTTASSTAGGGGIPEFPYQILAITVFTVLVIASYLVVRRRPARGRLGSRSLG